MTERQLLLLRHAKSDWYDSSRSDIERALAERGRKAAAAMGRYLVAEGLVPDHVLCSPARRAADTWSILEAELPAPPPMRTIEALYDFGDGEALLEVIREHGGKAGSLMIVGHNPAMESLARRLCGAGEPGLRRELEQKFPTAALAVLAFSGRGWSETADGAGRLLRFVRPR